MIFFPIQCILLISIVFTCRSSDGNSEPQIGWASQQQKCFSFLWPEVSRVSCWKLLAIYRSRDQERASPKNWWVNELRVKGRGGQREMRGDGLIQFDLLGVTYSSRFIYNPHCTPRVTQQKGQEYRNLPLEITCNLTLRWNQEISLSKWKLWRVIITPVPVVEEEEQRLTHLTNAAPSISSKETRLCIPEHTAGWTNKRPSGSSRGAQQAAANLLNKTCAGLPPQ